MSNEELWWSVRMRASTGGPHQFGGRHASGAERLVAESEVPRVIQELTARAQGNSLNPDSIRVSLDRIDEPITRVPVIRLHPLACPNSAEGRHIAQCVLRDIGVPPHVIDRAFIALHTGLHPQGGPIGGAAIWDSQTGNHDAASRGVRVSRFDYAPESQTPIELTLAAAGLAHFRTREALALATKTVWAGVTAEICWSDNVDYTTGYVATSAHGYVRIPNFKPPGACGGRIFFIDDLANSGPLLERLQRTPVFITHPLFITEHGTIEQVLAHGQY